MRSLLLTILFIAACGDNGNNTIDAHVSIDSKSIDAPADAGPNSVALTGGANDLLWNAATSTLYYTDDNANKLDTWTDANGTAVVGALPTVTGPNPGGLVRLADGTMLTLNFGDGVTTGALEEVSPAGVGTLYTGLDGTKKWLDLEQAADGTFYAAGFTGNSGAPVGRIYTLVINTTAHTVVATEILGPDTVGMEVLKKIVGMVVTADAIYGSDQTTHAIIKWDRTTLAQTTFSTSALSFGDFLYQMPNGDLLTGGAAVINRISIADGTVSVVDTGTAELVKIHGLAYDAVKHRLFAVDHQSSTDPDTLHIFSLAQ